MGYQLLNRGFNNSILHVDLSAGRVRKDVLDLGLATDFVGGWGINQSVAYQHTSPGIDSLSAENVIILAAGPLIGSICPGKQPLPGRSAIQDYERNRGNCIFR